MEQTPSDKIDLTAEEVELVLQNRKFKEEKKLRERRVNTPSKVAELKEDLYIYKENFAIYEDEILLESTRREYISNVHENFILICEKGDLFYRYQNSYTGTYYWRPANSDKYHIESRYENKFLENIRDYEPFNE